MIKHTWSLASGIICISTIGLIIIAFFNNNFESIYLLFSVFGACLAFLLYNNYPAKILMGDGGAYLLGFFAATSGIYFTNINTSQLSGLSFSTLPLFLIFIVPILDMIIVIFSRLKDGKSIFFPDRSHIHHRLLDLGFTHMDSVIIIYAVSQFFVSLALIITIVKFKLIIITSSVFILGGIVFIKCDYKSLMKLKISPR